MDVILGHFLRVVLIAIDLYMWVVVIGVVAVVVTAVVPTVVASVVAVAPVLFLKKESMLGTII